MNVLVVPAKDPAATAAAALRLLADPPLARRLLENAQQLLGACSLDSIVPRYLDVYDRMLLAR